MKQKNKKKKTLDDLANMMAKESKRVDGRFDELAGMVARGFEKTATKEEMNNRFNRVDQRTDDLERKIDKVDFRVDQVHEILDRGEKDFLGLQKRVQVLEKTNKPQHA